MTIKPNNAIIVTSLLLCLLTASDAAPFKERVDFRQPAGQSITLWGEGDEFYAVFETLNGFTVVFDDPYGGYCYARLSETGSALESTGVPAHLPPPVNIVPHLRLSPEAIRAIAMPRRLRWEQGTEIRERWAARKALFRKAAEGMQLAPPGSTTIGQKTGLTLLIDFSDDPASIAQTEIEAFCNGDNYRAYGNNGSVKKYFQDNSNGKLTYSNVVTAYIRVPQPKSYYNDLTQDCGIQGRKLIVDAIAALKALPNYNSEILPLFSPLSTDSQNRALALNVFYAGGNGGKWSFGLWPHSWVLSSPIELSPGGKKVYFYQLTNIGTQLALGTFCHENGHMLCDYPDIYDYDYDSAGGAGYFCLMNTGAIGPNPTQICAYLKRASGWATTIELTATSNLTATLSSTGANFNVFYRFQKPGVSTEYYLAECRHRSYRDTLLPASGIAIWHIDELGDRDNQSLTPNSTHDNYEVTLVQADNKWDLQRNKNQGDSTDLYFAGNTAAGYQNTLSDGSTPNARWWNGAPSGIFWRSFSAAGTTMTFRVGTNSAAPFVTTHPQSRTVLEGQSVSLTASVGGDDPLAYQWRKDGVAVAGATTNTLSFATATPSNSGTYSLLVTNIFGSAASSNAILNVLPTVPLAFALNNSLVWNVDSATPWYGQTNSSHDGVGSAKTFILGNNQAAELRSAATGPCTLKFWWKVSSQADADKVLFSLNGIVLAERSGEGGWLQESLYLPTGSSALKWTYSKDATGSSGQDCAWVDEVLVLAGATQPFFVLEPADHTGLTGVPATFSGLANGTPPIIYQWFYNGAAVAGATNTVLNLLATDATQAGAYTLRASSPHGSVTSAPAYLAIVPIAASGSGLFGQTSVSVLATNVLAISAGGWHSLALTDDNRVLAWGGNSAGQCTVPVSLNKAAAISAGGYHSLALKMDRSIVAWGADDFAQSTVPRGLSNCVSVAAGGSHSLALHMNGKVFAWGDNTWGQSAVPQSLSNVVAIAAGAFHSLALRSNGTVVAWGGNLDSQGFYAGQSVVPSGLSNIISLAAGNAHSVALRNDGRIFCWGSGLEGQLLVPSGLSAVAISASGAHTLALRENGSVAAWGANWDGQCDLPPGLTNVVSMAAGSAHSLLLLGQRRSEPQVLGVARQPGVFTVLARLSPGKQALLEYRNSMSGGSWIPVGSLTAGISPQFLLDQQAVGPQRFYRIKQW